MKTILWNLAIAAVATLLTLASCQRPIDVDGKTIFGRQAIDLMAEGETYEKAGNYAMALDRYGKALELSPRPAIYYHIGYCYYQRSEFTKAQEYLTAAKNLAGDYPAAEYLLSKVRIQLALAARQGVKPGATPAATPGKATMPSPPVVAMTPPKATPRQVAEVSVTPPERAPRVEPTPTPPSGVTRLTPTPRPTPPPERTPIAVERTPAATRTPAPVPTEAVRTPAPPTLPLISTPPPSVEPIVAPRPTPRYPRSTTQTVSTVPPMISPREVFGPEAAADLTTFTARTLPYSGATSGTTPDSPLLGQWQFHYEQAQSFLERKMDQEAVDELLLVLGAQPRHLEARLQLADAYDRLGRGEKALEQYEKARIYSLNNPKPYFRNGNYYLRHAEDSPQNSASYYDRARTYYYEAVNHDPKYYFAYHNVGITYMKQGSYEAARKWLEKAVEINPDYASAHRNLGILFEQHLKDPKRALQHYQKYLQLGGPDADEVKEWVRALEEAR